LTSKVPVPHTESLADNYRYRYVKSYIQGNIDDQNGTKLFILTKIANF
jgi:hypothetical protein